MFRALLMLLLSVLLAAAGPFVHAQSPDIAAERALRRPHWQCDLMFTAGDRWQLRCDDLQAQTDFDPALEDASPPVSWYVPTYSAPIDPRKVVELIRAVLCRGAPCEVQLTVYPR